MESRAALFLVLGCAGNDGNLRVFHTIIASQIKIEINFRQSFSTAADKNALDVPLYVDEERQRLITVLKIPFKAGKVGDWLRAGIAMSLKD